MSSPSVSEQSKIMSTFHKPRVFRSPIGCCICRAKSSSSRFTDSSRYSGEFQRVFQLEEERVGEICNACVLLVKRWQKLPRGSSRHWGHVVDARAGPGGRGGARRRGEDTEPALHKIRRKPTKVTKARVEDKVEGVRDRAVRRLEEEPLSSFLSCQYWRKERSTCSCLTIRGRGGEVVVREDCRTSTMSSTLTTMESLIEAELAALNSKVEVEGAEEDLGYCGSSIADSRSTNSPDSVRTIMDIGEAKDARTNTPDSLKSVMDSMDHTKVVASNTPGPPRILAAL